MATIDTLVVNLVAHHKRFVDGVTKGQKALLGIGRTAAGLIGPLAATAGGLTAVGSAGFLMAKGVQNALGFQQQMLNSMAIMGDLSERTRSTMEDTAESVAFSTRYSSTEAAQGFYFLAAAGLDAEQSIAALPRVAKFAQAGNFDLALATDLATDAQSSLGLTVKDSTQNLQNLTRVTDVLVKGNTIANASVLQFSTALTNGAGVALKMVNKDVEEGVAVLAAYADQGIKAEEAGTAFGIIMRDLSTKALENEKAFKAAGVGVFDQTGDMRNLADIIGDVENALSGLSDAQQKQTLLTLGFADKSVKFIQTLVGTSERIRGYEEALRAAGGMTDEVANKQLSPMTRALSKLSAGFDKFSANMLTPTLDSVAGSLEKVGTGMFEARVSGEQFRTFLGLITEDFKIFGKTTGSIGEDITAWVDGIQLAYAELEVMNLNAQIKMTEAAESVNRVLRQRTLLGRLLKDSSKDNALENLIARRDKFIQLKEDILSGKLAQDRLNAAAADHKAQIDQQTQAAQKFFDLQKQMQDEMEAESALQRMQSQAEQLQKSLMTPLEAFYHELENIFELMNANMLSAETFDRAIKDAEDRLRGTKDITQGLTAPGSNMGVDVGSLAAQQATDRFKNEAAVAERRREIKLAAKQREQANKKLDQINRNLKNNTPIQVQQVSLV